MTEDRWIYAARNDEMYQVKWEGTTAGQKYATVQQNLVLTNVITCYVLWLFIPFTVMDEDFCYAETVIIGSGQVY